MEFIELMMWMMGHFERRRRSTLYLLQQPPHYDDILSVVQVTRSFALSVTRIRAKCIPLTSVTEQQRALDPLRERINKACEAPANGNSGPSYESHAMRCDVALGWPGSFLVTRIRVGHDP
jgi:hypothetical protein